MNKNLNLKKSVALGSLLLLALLAWACGPSGTNNTGGNTNAPATNAKKGVEKVIACDDAQVITDMKATIDAKYPDLKAIMTKDLSAYSKDCSVNLMGKTGTFDNFKDFYDVASDTPNVVKVNIDLLFLQKSYPSPCGPDEEQCGDICVPVGQCWSKTDKQNANANTKTNTNTNTNSNSNSNARSKP